MLLASRSYKVANMCAKLDVKAPTLYLPRLRTEAFNRAVFPEGKSSLGAGNNKRLCTLYHFGGVRK